MKLRAVYQGRVGEILRLSLDPESGVVGAEVDFGENSSESILNVNGDLRVIRETGLKYKDGSGVWEGDIVGMSGIYDPETGQTERDIREVRFVGPHLAYVKVVNGTEDRIFVWDLIGDHDVDDDIEWIGTVFQHPELLD
jgi:hypothetical protein